MALPIVGNNIILTAIVIGLLGIVECFFGYRVFRLVLVVVGFLIGASIAVSLVNSDQAAITLIVGLIGGLIGAVILYYLYFLAVFLAGAAFGAVIATIIAANLVLTPTATTILIVVGAILGGFLGAILAKYIIILSTALSGATQIVYAAVLLLGITHTTAQTAISVGQPQTLVTTVIILILAAIGFMVQFNTTHHYTRIESPTPTT